MGTGPFIKSGSLGLGCSSQIDGSIFAAAIHFQFELQAITLVEVGHACALDGRDVDKRVGLAVIALDEAEAFHGIEELDRSAGLFTGQLTLRATLCSAALGWAGFNGEGLTFDAQVRCRDTTAAIDERELKRLAFCEAGQTGLLDCGNVDENVFAAIVAHDKAETLLGIEELNNATAFADDLGRHRATSATAAATASVAAATTTEIVATTKAVAEAAATAAAEAITAAAATAEAITAATETITAAAEAIAATAAATETVAGETTTEMVVTTKAVALVPAAPLPAAPTIKTHAV